MTMRLAEDCCDAPPFNCDRSPNTIISVEKPRFRFSWATPPPKPILCRGRKKARNHLNADAPLGLEQEQDRCGRGGRLGRVGRLGPRRGKSEKKVLGTEWFCCRCRRRRRRLSSSHLRKKRPVLGSASALSSELCRPGWNPATPPTPPPPTVSSAAACCCPACGAVNRRLEAITQTRCCFSFSCLVVNKKPSDAREKNPASSGRTSTETFLIRYHHL